ncbi:hypothetical protein GO304_04974 [Ralstonia solanacearum]|nr:hypothetical protein [Ralstonia solanacearum]NJZ80921.1 hypothetical protein [Ralstonia solanacearum]NKF82575.1 hypothetical protein [Ralstonia solanacearum]
MHGTSPELQIYLVIFARRFLPTTSKWIFLNLLEQLPILPDILVVLSQQKPPPWRQPQIRNDQRSPICQVLHVQWHEEVRCFGKYLTRPDIPPGRIALRLNSQAIQRTQPFLNVARNADFLLQVAFKVRRTNLQTNGSLLILHLYSHTSHMRLQPFSSSISRSFQGLFLNKAADHIISNSSCVIPTGTNCGSAAISCNEGSGPVLNIVSPSELVPSEKPISPSA